MLQEIFEYVIPLLAGWSGRILKTNYCILQIAYFDELDVPYINVHNNHKEKHKLHFDLRIPRLSGESDIAIELMTIEARFKCTNGVSIQAEKLTRELIEIAAKICHIYRYVKQSGHPISIPLRMQFNIADLD